MPKINSCVGISYRGPVAVLRSGKVKLTRDFYSFIVKAMKTYHGKEMLVSVHQAPSTESVTDFLSRISNS